MLVQHLVLGINYYVKHKSHLKLFLNWQTKLRVIGDCHFCSYSRQLLYIK